MDVSPRSRYKRTLLRLQPVRQFLSIVPQLRFFRRFQSIEEKNGSGKIHYLDYVYI
jgi:hypothetical protein